MNKEIWERVQSLLEDIGHECDRIHEAADSIYNICEDDITDVPDGYEELFAELPDGNKLSLADMSNLLELVRNWRKTTGL